MNTAAPVRKSCIIEGVHCVGMSLQMSIIVASKIASDSEITQDTKSIDLCRTNGLVVT